MYVWSSLFRRRGLRRSYGYHFGLGHVPGSRRSDGGCRCSGKQYCLPTLPTLVPQQTDQIERSYTCSVQSSHGRVRRMRNFERVPTPRCPFNLKPQCLILFCNGARRVYCYATGRGGLALSSNGPRSVGGPGDAVDGRLVDIWAIQIHGPPAVARRL